MGQLERYGLFVLVLVIALIIGVSIWGDPVELEAGGEGAGGGGKLAQLAVIKPQDPGRNRSVEPTPQGGESGPRTELDNLREQLGGGQGRPAPAPERDDPEVAHPPSNDGERTYVIQPGDILGKIALRELGSANHWQLIKDANPGLDESNLPVGKSIRIPAAPNRRRSRPATDDFGGTVLYKGREYRGHPYRIEPGDSMAKISIARFQSERYTHIIEGINPGVNPKRLNVGDIIRIPTRDEIQRLR